MTKRRAPLTFENALTRVASEVGWSEVARICRHKERTVRNWSEPDTTAEISLEAALELDLAWRAAGKEGAPFLTCYQTRLDAEATAADPSRDALIGTAAKAAKEGGEAVAAVLATARPGASSADDAIAERELEESIEAQTAALAAIRARRRCAAGDDLATRGIQ
ncbi:MAG TPA: hypothetical protein VNH53_03905 [Sphingomicrobium sp.]|nr:hypothetical protein [Sphingomicrobium sp.]